MRQALSRPHISSTALEVADVRPMDPRPLGEGLLRPTMPQPLLADGITELTELIGRGRDDGLAIRTMPTVAEFAEGPAA